MSSEREQWHLYLIRASDSSLYTGITIDVERRFLEHQNPTSGSSKGAKALRGKLPLSLVFQVPAGNRSAASQLEYRIKRLTKGQKEALVRGEFSIESLAPANASDE
ncbi:MAG: GIY-YIG nuclease family protein [Gammaproteobacteria bacterium]|jgi:putative endonuclease|nr:GIY-YIG nuclease family protein [Gammaproteobacteria bacterium]MDP6652493.1 GIY-YIG nuclease family protein [Gammaproteobacteria bacterium]|tara:strand:+ start:362 stop:679 length:318 start_codon:yes stop_codon:yes gene_type:complete